MQGAGCTGGAQVCTESTSVAHHQECATTHVQECAFRHKRAAAAYRLAHGHAAHSAVRGCRAVPHQECRSVPVHSPRVACRQQRGAAICTTEFVERRVRDCRPVEVPTSHTACTKVPHQVQPTLLHFLANICKLFVCPRSRQYCGVQVCVLVPRQVCRSGGRPSAPVEARQVCT